MDTNMLEPSRDHAAGQGPQELNEQTEVPDITDTDEPDTENPAALGTSNKRIRRTYEAISLQDLIASKKKREEKESIILQLVSNKLVHVHR